MHCWKCETPIATAPSLGFYCPNPRCDACKKAGGSLGSRHVLWRDPGTQLVPGEHGSTLVELGCDLGRGRSRVRGHGNFLR